MSKYVLITGASSGIGESLAKVFAENKYNLILTARREDKLINLQTRLEKDYGIKAVVILSDLSKVESAENLYQEIKNQNLEVEILVNNAGFGEYGDFVDLEMGKQQNMINVNIVSLMRLSHLFSTEMKERKSGKILNIASTAAFQPGPKMAVYFATKSFVLHFSQALSLELAKYNITVTAVCPGATQSEFAKNLDENNGLFKNTKNLPTSEQVADFAFKSLMNNKNIAIHTWKYFMMCQLTRFLPKKLLAEIIYKFI
jgi:uncharacterized protein